MNNKLIIWIIIPILILFSKIPTTSSYMVPTNKIIYVNDDAEPSWYDATHVKTIQEGIENATDGYTVFVYDGTYYENIIINKQINLVGADKKNTILDANGEHYAVLIKHCNVYLWNFTIINSTKILFPDPWEYGSITIWYSENVTLENNVFSNNFIAICLFQSENCNLKNNNMDGCNIVIWGNNLENYIHDIDKTNLANEKPIFYYKNCNNINCSGEIGQLFLINCTSCKIENMMITNVTNGFQVCYSNNIQINNNTIKDIKSTGIHFDHTGHCIVKNNILLDHKTLDFIFLDASSYNTFQNNIVHGYAVGITLMFHSNYNKFYNNDISSKKSQGMIFDQSNYNEIKFNNINGSFIDRILNKGPGDVLLSRGAFYNKFEQNYWAEWIGNKYTVGRICPKIILGVGSAIVDPHSFPVFFNFDFHPVSKAYVN